MLNGTADAAGHIQLGRHDLASLANLPVVGRVTRIHRRAGCPHGGTEFVGQGCHDFGEFFAGAQSTTAADDDLGCSQFWTVIPGDFTANESCFRAGCNRAQRLHQCRTTTRSSRIKTGRADGDHLGGIQTLHGGNRIASVNRALKGVRAVHLGDVRDLSHVEFGSNTWRNVLARRCSRKQDVGVTGGNGQNLGSHVFSQPVCKAGVISVQHLGDT